MPNYINPYAIKSSSRSIGTTSARSNSNAWGNNIATRAKLPDDAWGNNIATRAKIGPEAFGGSFNAGGINTFGGANRDIAGFGVDFTRSLDQF